MYEKTSYWKQETSWTLKSKFPMKFEIIRPERWIVLPFVVFAITSMWSTVLVIVEMWNYIARRHDLPVTGFWEATFAIGLLSLVGNLVFKKGDS